MTFLLRARASAVRSPARALSVRLETTEAAPTPAPAPEAPAPEAPASEAPASEAPAPDAAPSRLWRRPDLPMRQLSRTHFLTIPLHEHSPELKSKIAAFRDSIIQSNLTGLTKDSVAPRLSHFLELRLGSLNIEGFKGQTWRKRRPFKGQSIYPLRAERTPIPFAEVKEVLNELKAPIQEILSANGGDGALHVPLGNLRPLLHGPRKWFNPRKVNILFLEPADGPGSNALRAVNELVFKRLYDAGLWVETSRPSALSLTLANVRYHQGRTALPFEERQSFDLLSLYESEAFRAVEGAPPQGEFVDDATARPVDLGEGIARSLHLIPMREGEPDAVSEAERGEPAKADFTLEF